MHQLALAILLAFFLDLLLGDPPYRLHPIRLIGGLIRWLTTRLEGMGLGGKGGGVILAAGVLTVVLAVYEISHILLWGTHPVMGFSWDLFMGYSCLALKDLLTHTDRVLCALEAGNLAEARRQVALVVGRDVRFLDEKGVTRAAVETLAENFVDGFLSPVFWYLVSGALGYRLGMAPVGAGMAGMLAFKAASTLDSMVGYKDSRFRDVGWAGARLDDVMNFVPARLSLGILLVGAWICGLNAVGGLKTALRDRLKHPSPNSAHAESFAAGALLVRLGGPTVYPEGRKEKAWLGEENPDPVPMDIRKTSHLLRCSAWVVIGLVVGGLVLDL